jgi:hypothetical protein
MINFAGKDDFNESKVLYSGDYYLYSGVYFNVGSLRGHNGQKA